MFFVEKFDSEKLTAEKFAGQNTPTFKQFIPLAFISMLMVVAVLVSTSAQAQDVREYNYHTHSSEVPLWMIDGNLALISLTAYPGADFSRNLLIPFPNFRLNSPYLQSSGGGVNARLLNSDKVDLGLTLSASIPTKTKHLDARKDRDMPDLDPTVEAGLGLRYIPISNSDWEIKTQFPVRKATGIGFQDQDEFWKIHKPLDLGWTFSPRITFTRFFEVDNVRHEIDFEVGSKYATQQNMNFFYGIDEQFALPGETGFVAEEGLVNHWVELGWVRKHNRWRFSISAEYQDMHNAENLLSPLLEVKDSWFGFIILTYSFAQSDLMVRQDSEYKN